MWGGRFAIAFCIKYLKRNYYKKFIYFHKFLVQDHLHEHYCTFEQLVGKTLIEIESAVAKQTKNVRFCFFQIILQTEFFTTVKGILKNTF